MGKEQSKSNLMESHEIEIKDGALSHTDAAIPAQCSCPNVLIEWRAGLVRVQCSCPHVVTELQRELVSLVER